MASSKKRDRRGRRRGGSRGTERAERPVRPTPPCHLCGEPIEDILSALAVPPGGEPAHFDCALKKASEQVGAGEGEKVIYLGRGRFAVVEAEAYQQRKLKVIRQLAWEEGDKPVNWRVDLRAVVP